MRANVGSHAATISHFPLLDSKKQSTKCLGTQPHKISAISALQQGVLCTLRLDFLPSSELINKGTRFLHSDC